MANQFTKFTTSDAAKELGISVVTLRKRAKLAGITPVEFVKTGKRGRPEGLWSASSITKLKA